jgi:hypothetical protein
MEEGVVDMAEVVVVMIPAFPARTRRLITMINLIE